MRLEQAVCFAAAGAMLNSHTWTNQYGSLDLHGNKVPADDPSVNRRNSADWVYWVALMASGDNSLAAVVTAKVGARVLEETGKALGDLDAEGRMKAAHALSQVGHQW